MEKDISNPYNLLVIKEIKEKFGINEEATKEEYSEFFYYFDGIVNTKTSQSQHPAGIIACPINLIDNYGMFIGDDGQYILPINMEEIHEIGLAKYDILGLKNVGIVRKCCEYVGIKPPLSHEINWEDINVFNEVLISQIGMFQFEGDYSYKLLCDYIKLKLSQGAKLDVAWFTLINACLRPSGESYRDALIRGEFNKNPSKLIDNLLADTQGFLVYQEQTILFLQEICGLSGSEADNVRRAIGRKQMDRLQKALPDILEGYCKVSDQSRKIAEEEVKQFLKIIEDSAYYQFGKNHATGYSLLGYILMMLRHYHPVEFCTAYLNCVDGQTKEQDIKDGTQLAISFGISIEKPKFRKSLSDFVPDVENKKIYKGLGSIKDLSKDAGNKLYTIKDKEYSSFLVLLKDINDLKINSKSLEILIELDYFSEFGDPHFLKSQIEIYDELNTLYTKYSTCKQLRKSDLILPIDEVISCCGKGIEDDKKMLGDIDNEALIKVFRRHYKQLLSDTTKKYPYIPATNMDKIQYEVKRLGYTDITDDVNTNLYCLCGEEKNKWGTSFLTLYNIYSGVQKVYKVKCKYELPKVEVGDILKCATDSQRKGHYDENRNWIEDEGYVDLVINYGKIM